MSKLTLIINSDDYTMLHIHYLRNLFDKYFNIVEYELTATYDSRAIVVTNCLNKNQTWYTRLNCKVIIDNLWEQRRPTSTEAFVLTNQNWFWYNESLWYDSLGYADYVPEKTYQKIALMPMRLRKPHRDLLISRFADYLDRFTYSYNSRGIFLPSDSSIDAPEHQRFFNKKWYDDTYFSIVAETEVRDSEIFITEKTFKPIAYHHPFMIFGQSGSLAYLTSQGYESYSNLFDERYDSSGSLLSRLQIIYDNVRNFELAPYTNETLGKLSHNRNLFFNKDIVVRRIYTEIIEPILKYAEI